MLCNNCKKEIPDDSIFCIFCGSEINKGLIENSRINVDKLIESLNDIIESNKKQIVNLSDLNKYLQSEVERLNNLLRDKIVIPEKSKVKQTDECKIALSTDNNINLITDDSFLSNLYEILKEFNSIDKNKNIQHTPVWAEDDPKEIEIEKTFLVDLKKLFRKLKDLNYQNNFIDKRNKFVDIFEKLCHYKEFAINGMENGDYNTIYINEKAFETTVHRLFDYYNSFFNIKNEKA